MPSTAMLAIVGVGAIVTVGSLMLVRAKKKGKKS
jgi:hypothetical protein